MHPDDLAPGGILIVPRDAPDPLFTHSVIVLARYDKSGALGLMIHYRSDLTIQHTLAGVKGAEKRTDPVFVGGPVDMQVVLALLRAHSPPAGAEHISGDLYLMTSRQSIGTALAQGRKPSELRVFIGYTGWGPGQLEFEAGLRAWYIFPPDDGLAFDAHPETLWQRLIDKAQATRAGVYPDERTLLSGRLRPAARAPRLFSRLREVP